MRHFLAVVLALASLAAQAQTLTLSPTTACNGTCNCTNITSTDPDGAEVAVFQLSPYNGFLSFDGATYYRGQPGFLFPAQYFDDAGHTVVVNPAYHRTQKCGGGSERGGGYCHNFCTLVGGTISR